MDITERKITKIAREVSKFTVRTLRAEALLPATDSAAPTSPDMPISQ